VARDRVQPMESMCASFMYAAGFRTFFFLSLCHVFFFPRSFFFGGSISKQSLMQGMCSSRTRLDLERFCCVFLHFFFFLTGGVILDTRMPGTYLGTALSFWDFVDEER
jgi:hypothetical protein